MTTLRDAFGQLRRLRLVELQLLITVLLFFAAGYLLVVVATGQSELQTTFEGLLRILWPSSLPLLLFLAISLGLSLRSPTADQLILPLVALLAGLSLMMTARLEPGLNQIVFCSNAAGERFRAMKALPPNRPCGLRLVR
jgi:hypothetical protein